MPQRRIVRTSIKKLLRDHASQPFSILREAGVQAELRGILLNGFAKQTTACLRECDGNARFLWSDPANIERVQLEMKIGVRGVDARLEEANPALRTDIVVLTTKHPVELTCYPNGPGDVVAALRANDVNVAIEIKASPSRTSEQKQKYAKDIERLLKLNTSHGIASFFVMLDKSQTLYGDYHRKPTRTSIDENSWAALKRLVPGIETSTTLPKSVKRYVELCFLDAQRKPKFMFAWLDQKQSGGNSS